MGGASLGRLRFGATICHRRRHRLSDDELVDLAGAAWQERLGKSDLARAAIPGEAADSGKPGRAFAGRTIAYKCGACQPPNSASSRAATANAISSRHDLAITCTPSGRPSLDVPQRTTAAGHPVML